jgi:hypothetical protein
MNKMTNIFLNQCLLHALPLNAKVVLLMTGLENLLQVQAVNLILKFYKKKVKHKKILLEGSLVLKVNRLKTKEMKIKMKIVMVRMIT